MKKLIALLALSAPCAFAQWYDFSTQAGASSNLSGAMNGKINGRVVSSLPGTCTSALDRVVLSTTGVEYSCYPANTWNAVPFTSGTLGSFALLNNPLTTGGDTLGFNGTVFTRIANPGAGTFCFNWTSSTSVPTWTACPGAGGGISSIAWALPSWLTASPSTLTANGTQTFSAATGQSTHQVLGTFTGTSVALGALTLSDLPGTVVNTGGSYSDPSWLTLSAGGGRLTGFGTMATLNNPMTTAGDFIVGGSSGALTRLATPGNGTFCPSWSSGVVTWITCPGAGGGISSVGLTMPAWLSVANSPLTANGTIAVTAATGQTTHQVLGTCGTATSFVPCSLVAGDLPPVTNIAGGAAGSIIYQSAANATALLAGNTAATDQVLVSHGTGSVAQAPTFSNAPTLSAANMTGLPAGGVAAIGADNIIINSTGSSAVPTTQAIPSCANDGAHALVYVGHTLTCESITAGGGTAPAGHTLATTGSPAIACGGSTVDPSDSFIVPTLTGNLTPTFATSSNCTPYEIMNWTITEGATNFTITWPTGLTNLPALTGITNATVSFRCVLDSGGSNAVCGAAQLSAGPSAPGYTTYSTLNTTWACSSALNGFLAFVSDSNTSVLGATVAGGGSTHTATVCNGTNWIVGNGATGSAATVQAPTGTTPSLNCGNSTSLAMTTINLGTLSANISPTAPSGATGCTPGQAVMITLTEGGTNHTVTWPTGYTSLPNFATAVNTTINIIGSMDATGLAFIPGSILSTNGPNILITQSAPGYNAGSGQLLMWGDSINNTVGIKDSSGNVYWIPKQSACSNNQVVTGLASTGQLTCSTIGGTVTYTSSHSLGAADAGMLVIMNCSSSCAVTLPNPQPSTTFASWVMTTGSSVATITLGSTMTWNAQSSVPVLNSFRPMMVRANSATATDYEGDAPIAAGTNVTLTPSANALTVTASATGATAFSALTNGTNTAAAMVVGSGASMGTSGTGTINANLLTSPSLGAGSSPVTETWVVGTGGVTANTLVQIDASAPSKIVAATTGGYGVAMSTQSATANVEVARFGTVNCVTDTGGSTAGDLVILGTGSAIDCKDSGQTSSANINYGTAIIGIFRSTASGGSSALVELTPEKRGARFLRSCDLAIGDTSASSALTNAQLGPQKRMCYIASGSTILEMDVSADAGTPNVIVGRDNAGTVVNIVSAALATAASGGIACANTGGTTGLDGATTCSSTLQNTALTVGGYLELVSGTAGGTAKLMTVHVIYY